MSARVRHFKVKLIGYRQIQESKQSSKPLRARHFRHNAMPSLMTSILLAFLAHAAILPAQQPSPARAFSESELPDTPQAQTSVPPRTPPTPSPTLQPDEVPAPESGPNTPGTIRGVVQGRDGSVYQGVRIALTQPTPIALPERSAITDENGRFQFAAVPAGKFTLTAASDGFATQSMSATLAPGEVYDAPAIILEFSIANTEIRVTASRQEIAQAQIKDEEKQRVLGIIPNFYVSYVANAAPLTKKQKFSLAWRSSIDPISFLSAGFFAGVQQAEGDFKGYGYGAQGYGKRFGANYADDFIGGMIGGAILPSLLKQDPRYFYKGTGTVRSRILYALATSVIAKGDNGRWQPNYSGIIGELAAGGISNIYYPASDRNGASLTFENAAYGIAGSAVGNLFQEFLVKRLTPRIPKYAPTPSPSTP